MRVFLCFKRTRKNRDVKNHSGVLNLSCFYSAFCTLLVFLELCDLMLTKLGAKIYSIMTFALQKKIHVSVPVLIFDLHRFLSCELLA